MEHKKQKAQSVQALGFQIRIKYRKSIMAHTPHLRLTPAEVKALWQQKCFAAKGYLYLLVLAHRRVEWGWRIENVSEFCKAWDIPRRTFYKAKAALITDGLLSEDIIGALELTPHACAPGDTAVPQKAQIECAPEGTLVNCDAPIVQDSVCMLL